MEIRKALQGSRPYGSGKWVSGTVAKFGLENAMRGSGRPKNGQKNGTHSINYLLASTEMR